LADGSRRVSDNCTASCGSIDVDRIRRILARFPAYL
jgi:hypothetical protein